MLPVHWQGCEVATVSLSLSPVDGGLVLKDRIYDELKRAIIKRLHESLKHGQANDMTFQCLGYTMDELIRRLASTLPAGYAWKDYLAGRLHLDHIIPASVFRYTSMRDSDCCRCWALKNLQLLVAEDNLRKGARLLQPFQLGLGI